MPSQMRRAASSWSLPASRRRPWDMVDNRHARDPSRHRRADSRHEDVSLRARIEGTYRMAKGQRDVERMYSTAEVVAKLRRLADALEEGKPFRIQVASERIRVPARAQFSIEHERGDDEEEIEFQLKWPLETESAHDPLGDAIV